MTARLFSILRRTPGLIDFITPFQALSTGVVSYRLKTDTTPTGAFGTTVLTAPRTGYVQSSVAGAHNVIQNGDNVRIIFKPSDFSLSDTDAFWLKLVYVNAANAEMGSPAPSAPTLILPPYTGPIQSGFSATATVSAQRIDLPRAMENFRIRNLSSSLSLAVSFHVGGFESTIPAGQELAGIHGNVSSFWVRGVGGSVDFSTAFTYAFPR